MTVQPQTLFDIAGVQARIHTLPGRPPFMTAPDLAGVYQTPSKRLVEVVKRNPRRFREKDCFRLTEAETAHLKSQSATSMMANRDFPMVFTHTGAYGLSFVLTSDVAIEMGHVLTDAFADQEARALAEMRRVFVKVQFEAGVRRIRFQVCQGMRAGMNFEGIRRLGNYSGPKVADALRDCLALGLIDRLPHGMPSEQLGLFTNA